MNEFVSSFWSNYIAVIVIVSIIGLFYLLFANNKQKLAKGEQAEKLDHVWDDDLQELNNPLPRWWLWMFIITLVFSVGYLALYPGLGSFKGYFNWTSDNQYEKEVAVAQAQYQPLYDKYLKQSVEQVSKDPEARAMGERLFLTYCIQCHGSDARGAKGFPNLRDNDWLFGGTPEDIQTSITNGRGGAGLMRAWGPELGDEGVKNVAQFVLSLSGRQHDSLRAQQGKAIFKQNCVACHGAEGKGTPAMGAPNLTDKIWLYGGSEKAIIESINKGRNGKMPPHLELLGEAKVHLLTAYIYGLPKD